MRHRLLSDTAGQRTFVVVLATGDEVQTCLQKFADDEHLGAAQVTAIGAFERARLAYFDWEKKDYLAIPVDEQVEVLSLNGDIALEENDEIKLHLHTVLGRRDASTIGGHLLEAHVRPTLEVIITEAPAHLRRRFDPHTNLALIDPAAK